MTPEIDIYSDNPTVTLDYMLAVMTAANNGDEVEARVVYGPKEFRPARSPNWNWVAAVYRISPTAKPKIAAGHNPANLTEEQVGVKDGWRLLSEAEISSRASAEAARKDIEVRLHVLNTWANDSEVTDFIRGRTYRTQRPVDYFLSPKKKRVSLTSSDLAHPVVWLRLGNCIHSLVTAIDQQGVFIEVGQSVRLYYEALMDRGYEYSTDHVNWKLCYKEVEG